MLIGIASVKGSPGTTMLGLGLAAVWPGGATLLVEADPSGGDVGVWYRTGQDPGLVSLAAATRRTTGDGARDVDVLDHAHDLGSGLWVVPGPVGAGQARAAVELLADRRGLLRTALTDDEGLDGLDGLDAVDAVVVDLGRLDPDSAALPLLADLDVLLIVSRAGVSDLAHLAARGPGLADLGNEQRPVGMLLTQGCRYRTVEVEEAVGLPLIASVPHDETSALAITGSPTSRWGRSGRRLGHRPLLRALRDLADRLTFGAPPRVSRQRSVTPGSTARRAITVSTGTSQPSTAGRIARSAAEAGWTRAGRAASTGNPWVRR